MPSLVSATLCDNIGVTEGRLSAIGLAGNVNLQTQAPTTISFVIILEIHELPEINPFTLQTRILDSEENKIAERSNVNSIPDGKPLMIALDIRNFYVPKIGKYKFQVFIDDEFIGERPVEFVFLGGNQNV